MAGPPPRRNGTPVKVSQREMAKHIDDAVAHVLAEHEKGLKNHGDLLRASVLAGFGARLRHLVFGFKRPGFLGRFGVPVDGD